MRYDEVLNSKFSEPATILSYKDGKLSVRIINDRFIPELWMNVSTDVYIKGFPDKCLDEDNLKTLIKAVEKCIKTGEEQTAETWRLMFSDCCGYDKVCLKSRLILMDNSPEGALIYEGVRNITNEKRTQDTLQDIEYRYKQASEQINIYNWEYYIDTKEMRPCYRCMRDLGLPAVVKNYPEPAIDMGIFPPDYADMYREMLRKVDEGAPELEADIPLTVGRVPFRVKYTTEFDENGKPVKAFGSATLISETELGKIKLDNQIIASLAEEYSCIYIADFVSDSVKIVKQTGILSVGDNYGCEELIKLIASKLDDGTKGQDDLLSDISVVRTELFSDCERREFVYKDDKENRWVRIEYHVVERSNDKVDRMLIMVSLVDDLRARKMDADRLIASQKEELEDKQKMLILAIDEANRANKAKTEFFSSMSHDIRTPMNAITGFSKLAKDEIDDKEHLEDYLDKIISAGDHLMDLINDILDMSRIESGKMEIMNAPIILKKAVSECADMIRVKMDEKNIDFSVDLDEMGEDVVEGDKLRLNQVLLNLLSNAYKFTPDGGSVYLEGKLKDKNVLLTYEIRVRDTGIGMSREYAEHIWEAYSREDTEVVHETQGTGLGMVIVKNIVNLMHGSITLNTEKGKGSEFIILLPLDPSTGIVKESSGNRETEESIAKRFDGRTVLVVDDTPLNLKLADRILSKMGLNVRVSNNGVDAIEQIKSSRPGDIDLILMDMLMPVMDGIEATKRIRALDDRKMAEIPIIAMTASAFESDIKKALDAGMNAHVSKPFILDDLVAKIDDNLSA